MYYNVFESDRYWTDSSPMCSQSGVKWVTFYFAKRRLNNLGNGIDLCFQNVSSKHWYNTTIEACKIRIPNLVRKSCMFVICNL